MAKMLRSKTTFRALCAVAVLGFSILGVASGTYFWTAAVSPAAVGHSSSAGPPHFAYMLGCNSYLKIDTSTQKVIARGDLLANVRALGLSTLEVTCPVMSVKYDSKTQMVYALLGSDRPTGSVDTAYYWLVALRLPDFSLVSKTLREYPADRPPTLFVNPDTQELLLYDEDDSSGKAVAQFEHYELPQLKFLRSEPADGDETFITDQAYWWHAENEIVDGSRVLNGTGRLLKEVNVDDLLTDALKREFQALDRPCLGDLTKKCLDMMYADSQAGQMLFVLQNDDTADPAVNGSGVAVYSISRDTIISSFPIAYPATNTELAPTVHLTPDGERVVVEQYNWIKSSESGRDVRFETGKIAVYDVERGELLNTITLTPPPGYPARVIAFSPDSSLMYYGGENRIYAVDLTGNQPPQVTPLKGPPGQIFFASQ